MPKTLTRRVDILESDVSTLQKELREFRAEVRQQFVGVDQQFAEMRDHFTGVHVLQLRHSIELRALNEVAVSLLQDGDKTRAEVRGLREEMNSRFDEVLKRLP